MNEYRQRLWIARGVLILAVVMAGVAHWFPLESPGVRPVRLRGDLGWMEHWSALRQSITDIKGGFYSPQLQLIRWFYPITILLVVVLPFPAAYFSRARAVLWVTVLLVAGTAGWNLLTSEGRMGIRMGPGTHLWNDALWLALAGLLLIPKCGANPGPARWRWLTGMMGGWILMVAAPWMMRPQVDKWMAGERLEACIRDIHELRRDALQFSTICGRLATREEGWQGMISRPAGMPAWRDWERILARPPIDPWGHAYRYATEEPVGSQWSYGCPKISSDGPDGVPGTPDDVVFPGPMITVGDE